MTYNSAYTGPQIDAAARLASIIFDDLPAMLADARDYAAHTAGDVFWTSIEGFRYRVAASAATDHHLTTAGGVKLYVQPSDDGVYNFKAFNPAADGATDDHPVLLKALAIVDADGVGPSLSFPPGDYFMGSTIDLIAYTKMIGPNSGQANARRSANLIFPADTMGVCINRLDTLSTGLRTAAAFGADGSIIEGLGIISQGGTDRTKHGVWPRARVVLRHCTINGFPGSGIFIHASLSETDPMIRGEASLCRVETVYCLGNKTHGLHIDGPDANAGIFINLNCSQNGRWGIFDSSFLGNIYVGCHIDANGLATKGGNSSTQSCFVSFGGNRYQAMADATEAELVATEPGDDETIWSYRGVGGDAPSVGIALWVASSAEGTYFVGGGVRTEGAVNYSLFLGCYNEAPWAMWIEGPTMIIGGHMISFLRGGRTNADAGARVTAQSFRAAEGNTSVTIADNDANGDILRFVNLGESAPTAPWRLKYSAGDYVWDNANSGTRIACYFTSHDTTKQFGTSAAVPYIFGAPTLGLGSGLSARRQTTGTAAPTSGNWGRGDIVWNVNAAAAGYAGWICITAGTPGTWKQFGAIEA